MIRTLKRLIATDGGDNKEYVELACLSTDSKPTTGIITGSVLYEVDTGKQYEFDEAADEWVEQPAGGGSGLPPVETTDKDKYLHTNASTGELEWSEVESGGGTLYIDTVLRSGKLVNDNVTYQDVYNACTNGKTVVVRQSGLLYYLQSIMINGSNCSTSFVCAGQSATRGEVIRLYSSAVSIDSTIELSTYTDQFDRVVELTGGTTLTPLQQMSISDVKDGWVFYIHSGNFMAGETMDYCDIAYRSNGAMFSTVEIVIKSRYTGKMYTTGASSASAALSFTEVV